MEKKDSHKNLDKIEIAKDKASNLLQLQNTFSKAALHELRNPLNSIIGFSQLLRSQLKEQNQENLADEAKSIYHAGEKLLVLFEEVFRYFNCLAEIQNEKIENKELLLLEVLNNIFKKTKLSENSEQKYMNYKVSFFLEQSLILIRDFFSMHDYSIDLIEIKEDSSLRISTKQCLLSKLEKDKLLNASLQIKSELFSGNLNLACAKLYCEKAGFYLEILENENFEIKIAHFD